MGPSRLQPAFLDTAYALVIFRRAGRFTIRPFLLLILVILLVLEMAVVDCECE